MWQAVSYSSAQPGEVQQSVACARIIEALKSAAQEAGCYKVILDCAGSNAPFYEKCGLIRKEVQMVRSKLRLHIAIMSQRCCIGERLTPLLLQVMYL